MDAALKKRVGSCVRRLLVGVALQREAEHNRTFSTGSKVSAFRCGQLVPATRCLMDVKIPLWRLAREGTRVRGWRPDNEEHDCFRVIGDVKALPPGCVMAGGRGLQAHADHVRKGAGADSRPPGAGPRRCGDCGTHLPSAGHFSGTTSQTITPGECRSIVCPGFAAVGHQVR